MSKINNIADILNKHGSDSQSISHCRDDVIAISRSRVSTLKLCTTVGT